MNGTELLARFRETRSDSAFQELVKLYTNLVYSVAKRRLASAALAEEAAQAVFIRLANAAPQLRGDAELVAWLHRTTIHVSIDLWRSESRRRLREQHAASMQSNVSADAAWTDMVPMLDEALDQLNAAERQTILLRFFAGKSMRDLGLTIGVSEDAAKMRVSRAVDRLRAELASRGVTCSAAALAALLAERSVEAAPANVAVILGSLKVPAAATAGAGAAFVGMLFRAGAPRAITSIAAAIVIVGVATGIWSTRKNEGRKDTGGAAGVSGTVANNASGVANNGKPNTVDTNASNDSDREPDPRMLLLQAARARQRIQSGTMELESWTRVIRDGGDWTNHNRIKASFDGLKRRFESYRREYRNVGTNSEQQEAIHARMRDERLDQEAAVRAGLLEPFEAHVVSSYDGAVILQYRETDGRPQGTSINDPGHGSADYIFDPRCLGVSGLSPNETVETSIPIGNAKEIKLTGRDVVEGVPAWQIHMQSQFNEGIEFWIDVEKPHRILKRKHGFETILLKYGGAPADDPLPTLLTSVAKYPTGTTIDRRIVRSRTEYNVAVDPASWTLAGLKMPVGVDVSDSRNHRRIGYWTGTGLSEQLPPTPQTNAPPPVAPDLARLVHILDVTPTTAEGFDAANWILLNTPDGPEVVKAAEVILQEHIYDTNLLALTWELERVRHRCSTNLLEAMLAKNPSVDVRGNACFTLATLFQAQSHHGKNKEATVSAEKYLEQTMKDFGQVKLRGRKLAEMAEKRLFELRHLRIGSPAPEITGENLDGEKMKLSDFRGKVTLLVWWENCCSPERDRPELRKMRERLAGQPFAIVGVYSGDDAAKGKAMLEKDDVPWPSFRDGRYGPIAKAWNMDTWVSVITIDRNGIIRDRESRDSDLMKVVDGLMRK